MTGFVYSKRERDVLYIRTDIGAFCPVFRMHGERSPWYEREQEFRNGVRQLFFDFPEDKASWEVEDSYMFGPDLLVSPVMEAGAAERRIYLPEGASWTDAWTGEVYNGGRTVTVAAPLDIIPVMIRDGREDISFLS